MRPVVTVAEMRAADAAARSAVDESVLVARAGTAVAGAALELLGGGYGRRVVVVAGKGNNGADGRVAAALLRRRGAAVTVVPAATGTLPVCDLVVDAAYGTGFRGRYEAPPVPAGARVLAVDIPSGVAGDTGEVGGRPMPATRTVTFAALKPGLLQGEGADLAGAVEVVDIGVATGQPGVGLVEDDDVAASLPRRPRQTHKWATAVGVVAGSPGMEGAAALSSRGASHAGAGMVRLAVPDSEVAGGGTRPGPWPLEAVRQALPAAGWAEPAFRALERCRSVVVGPGLGRSPATRAAVRTLIERLECPVVADADALVALGTAEETRALAASRTAPLVLTPHDGEYRGLAGEAPGADRIAAARRLAEATGSIVLLKGPLTAVGVPGDRAGDPRALGPGWPPVLLAAAGSGRLATAGTGDVLSGMIGAFIARGLAAAPAAALAAHVHGRAAGIGHAEGLVSPDLPALVAEWLSAGAAGA